MCLAIKIEDVRQLNEGDVRMKMKMVQSMSLTLKHCGHLLFVSLN